MTSVLTSIPQTVTVRGLAWSNSRILGWSFTCRRRNDDPRSTVTVVVGNSGHWVFSDTGTANVVMCCDTDRVRDESSVLTVDVLGRCVGHTFYK